MTSEANTARLNDCVTPWNSHLLDRCGAKNLVGDNSSLLAILFSIMSLLIAGCGAANTHIEPIQIAITPGTVTLSPGQGQQFAVTSSAAHMNSLLWAIN